MARGEVEKVLSKLKRGDLIKIYWLDASESELPREMDPPLPNHVVETRVEEVGEFLCVQRGRFSGDPHLIYVISRMDGRARIGSIRLCDIYRIQVYDEKKRRKASMEVSKTRRRSIRRFGNGVVKYYRYRGVGRG